MASNDEETVHDQFWSVQEVVPMAGVVKSPDGGLRPSFFLKIVSLDGRNNEDRAEHLYELSPMDALRTFSHLVSLAMTNVDAHIAAVEEVMAPPSHSTPTPYL